MRPTDMNTRVVKLKSISKARIIKCRHLICNLGILDKRLESMRATGRNIDRKILARVKVERQPSLKGRRTRPQVNDDIINAPANTTYQLAFKRIAALEMHAS